MGSTPVPSVAVADGGTPPITCVVGVAVAVAVAVAPPPAA